MTWTSGLSMPNGPCHMFSRRYHRPLIQSGHLQMQRNVLLILAASTLAVRAFAAEPFQPTSNPDGRTPLRTSLRCNHRQAPRRDDDRHGRQAHQGCQGGTRPGAGCADRRARHRNVLARPDRQSHPSHQPDQPDRLYGSIPLEHRRLRDPLDRLCAAHAAGGLHHRAQRRRQSRRIDCVAQRDQRRHRARPAHLHRRQRHRIDRRTRRSPPTATARTSPAIPGRSRASSTVPTTRGKRSASTTRTART